jgi:hypothetical protein
MSAVCIIGELGTYSLHSYPSIFATSSYLIIKTVSFIAVVYQSEMRHLVTAEEEEEEEELVI